MKIKKVMALAMASAMVISMALSGCGSDGGSESKESSSSGGDSKSGATEVTFWTLNTRQNAVDPIVEEFNKANDDVKVTVSYYDTDGIKDACKVAASSRPCRICGSTGAGAWAASMQRMALLMT